MRFLRALKNTGFLKWLLPLVVVIGIIIIVLLFLIPAAPPFTEIQVADELFDSNLEGEKLQLTKMAGGKQKSVNIRKANTRYIASIDKDFIDKGTWQLEIQGYQPVILTINENTPKKKTLQIQFKPTFGRIRVRPVNARLPEESLSGMFKVIVGTKQKTGDAKNGVVISPLPPGEHLVEVFGIWVYPQKEYVTVTVGQTADVIVHMEPEVIPVLKIRSNPEGASIYWDCKKRTEKTPAAILMNFRDYKIVVSKEGFQPIIQNVSFSLSQPIVDLILELKKVVPISGDPDIQIKSIDGSSYPGIKLTLGVKHPNGDAVMGLKKEDILLEESCEELCLRAAPGLSVQDVNLMDIVFFIDTTSSMGGELNSVKQNIEAFCHSLLKQNINFRLAGYSFGDEVPYREKFPFTGEFEDSQGAEKAVAAFKGWLLKHQPLGGGDGPENPLDTLIDAGTGGLQFRADTGRIGILITDAPAHVKGDWGGSHTTATFEKAKNAVDSIDLKLYFSSPVYKYETKLAAKNLGWPFNSNILMKKFLNELLGWYILDFKDEITAAKEQTRRFILKVRIKNDSGNSRELIKRFVFYPMDW